MDLLEPAIIETIYKLEMEKDKLRHTRVEIEYQYNGNEKMVQAIAECIHRINKLENKLAKLYKLYFEEEGK